MTAARENLEKEVFRALFASVAEEMGVVLQRSSFSPNIKERLDYSCALFTQDGKLFAQAAHIPVHLGSAPLSVRAAMAAHEFVEGDSVLLNDPYQGGTHLPDMTLVTPVFLGQRRPSFFVANRAHHADVGGAHPGSMGTTSDVFGEGIRVPPVVLARDGRMQRDVMRLLLANVRTPVEREVDLRAQLAANHCGVRRMQALRDEYGRGRIARAADQMMDVGEARMKALLRRIPNGRYEFEDVLDDDGFGNENLPIRLEMTVRGSRACLDFRRSSPQVRGSLNANPAIVWSAVLYGFQCLMEDGRAPNEGMARPLDVRLERGSILDPLPGAAVAAGNVETSQRLVDVVFGVLAQAVPNKIPAASQGTMNNLTIGSSVGDSAFSYYETTGGGAGASADGPGESGLQVHMTNTWNTPVEALELAYPLQVERYTLARGSGGRGRHRGGDGIERVVTLLRDATVSVISERRLHAPWGLDGGQPGRPGRNWVVQRGTTRPRPGKFTEELNEGDQVGMRTPGGGGHGKPTRKGTR